MAAPNDLRGRGDIYVTRDGVVPTVPGAGDCNGSNDWDNGLLVLCLDESNTAVL